MKERRKVEVVGATAEEIEEKYGYTVEQQKLDEQFAEEHYACMEEIDKTESNKQGVLDCLCLLVNLICLTKSGELEKARKRIEEYGYVARPEYIARMKDAVNEAFKKHQDQRVQLGLKKTCFICAYSEKNYAECGAGSYLDSCVCKYIKAKPKVVESNHYCKRFKLEQ